MARFVVDDHDETPLAVSIENDSGDVNIHVNNELIGWLCGSDGCLHLTDCANNSLKNAGVQFDGKDRIKVR